MRLNPLILLTAIVAIHSTAYAAEFEPIAFVAQIGGSGDWKTVKLNQGTIIYSTGRSSPLSKSITIKPSKKAWEEFRKEINTIGVWSWKQDYGATGKDGTEWSIEISYHDASMKSKGHNIYPSAHTTGGVKQETQDFIRLRKAIAKLIGNKPFC